MEEDDAPFSVDSVDNYYNQRKKLVHFFSPVELMALK